MIGVQATGACNPEYALVIPGYSIEESLWSTCKYLHCVFFTIQSIYIIRIVQVNGSGIISNGTQQAFYFHFFGTRDRSELPGGSMVAVRRQT